MNDPLLLAQRLNDLANLASRSNTGFEKASVYSATKSIQAEFNSVDEEFDGYTLEKVTKACWHICAAIGYDISNNHDISHHVSWAYGEISTLKDVLEKRYSEK